MAKRPVLTPAAYALLDQKTNLKGEETYSVVQHFHRGAWRWSIHIFSRMPNEHEMQKYESTASSVEFKGKRAKVKGAQIFASADLYNVLIDRVIDMPVGARVLGEDPDPPVGREQAIKVVNPMTKRGAISELVGQTYGASTADDDDEDDEDDRDARDAERS